MLLNNLVNNFGAKKNKKRLGRGIGSGKGKTCGRGVKGQTSRSGVAIKGFEGGQMPLIKRLAKRGFNNINSKNYIPVSIVLLEQLIKANKLPTNTVLTKDNLVQIGLIKNTNLLVKLVAGVKELTLPIEVKFDAYSATAKGWVEKAGGKII